MTYVFIALHVLLVVGFTTRILLRDDFSPPARLAWFVVLVVLPYGGIIAYFLFGEVDLGQKADARHEAVFDEIRSKASHLMGSAEATDRLIDPSYRPAFHYAGSINGFQLVDGNSAELMADAA
ncbi:MAG: PLDc N-terminal domain-containing protein, partial [Pseudomonadota bacterium]